MKLNLTPKQKAFERLNIALAWEHFWPEGQGAHKPGYVLHHKDPSLRYSDLERYLEYRPEDLELMTKSEHSRLHNTGRHTVFSDETRAKMSAARKGRLHWVKGSEHRVSKECPGEGWTRGIPPRAVVGAEGRLRMSQAHLGLHWWTDGTEHKLCRECPGEGWTLGKLSSGCSWWTNGVESRLCVEWPGEGWERGRTYNANWTDEARDQASRSLTGGVWWNNGVKEQRFKEAPGPGWSKGRLKLNRK